MTANKRTAVDLNRLRAAYQASGFSSWYRFARAARVSHPTVSRLLNRRIKAVNAPTLTRLAAALRVPAEWLTGAQRHLPHTPEWRPFDRNRKGPSLWERPTVDAVRYSWLMQQIETALRRDLVEWYGQDAGRAYDSWGHGLFAVFNEVASSIAWRTACLEPSLAGSWHVVIQSDDSPSINWLTHVLEPWFAGRAYLNSDILRRVFEALLTNPERLWGSATGDADALRGLERYGAALKEFVGTPDP